MFLLYDMCVKLYAYIGFLIYVMTFTNSQSYLPWIVRCAEHLQNLHHVVEPVVSVLVDQETDEGDHCCDG